MPDQSEPKRTDIDDLDEALGLITADQMRFVVARLEHGKDKEAAESIGLSPSTVKHWENKADVDKVVRLMAKDGIITARHILRRNVAKAAAVKVALLDSEDEKVRLAASNDVLDREMGKAVQPTHNETSLNVRIDGLAELLDKVYGPGS